MACSSFTVHRNLLRTTKSLCPDGLFSIPDHSTCGLIFLRRDNAHRLESEEASGIKQ